MIPVSFKVYDKALEPTKAHPNDAGFDIKSDINVEIIPGRRVSVLTGLSIAIPPGYFGLVSDRSGLAKNHGITTLAGVIDSDYRGEISVILLNTGDTVHTVERGNKIAQLLILPVPEVSLYQIDELPGTERGAGGFGSTGK